MDSLSFLMFWKSTASPISPGSHFPSLGIDEEDNDDSLFELDLDELSPPDLNTNQEKKNRRDSLSPSPSPSLSSIRLLSKRKVMPMEPQASSCPQSPLSRSKSKSKSSLRFRVPLFQKSKSMPNPKKMEPEGPGSQLLLRAESSLSEECGSASRRFSTDGVQRYFKLVKPLSTKGSSNVTESETEEELRLFSRTRTWRSPLQSPSPVKSRFVGGNGIGNGAMSSKDDEEGIRGAILHCKKSSQYSSLSRECANVVGTREHPAVLLASA